MSRRRISLDVASITLGLGVALVCLALLWCAGSGCYHCADPNCSNLPPEPDPFQTVTKYRDASRD